MPQKKVEDPSSCPQCLLMLQIIKQQQAILSEVKDSWFQNEERHLRERDALLSRIQEASQAPIPLTMHAPPRPRVASPPTEPPPARFPRDLPAAVAQHRVEGPSVMDRLVNDEN